MSQEEDLSILPIKFVESDYSVRQNQQNDHTKSHGQSNVQNSRGQGSSYRTPDASTTMVKSLTFKQKLEFQNYFHII